MKKFLIGLVVVIVLGVFFYCFRGNLADLSTNLFNMQKEEIVVFQTNKGDITLKLAHVEAPENANNFLELAKEGRYENTIFHRVIEGFMIQGGDYENFNGTGGKSFEGEDLKDEFSPKLSHVRGALSMANRGPNTNASQFFIAQKDAKWLDGRHTIIGQVINGMEVVDSIAGVKVGPDDKPLEDVKILGVTVK